MYVNAKFNVFTKAWNDWKCTYKIKFGDFEYSWELMLTVIIKRTIVRFINMFQNAQCEKAISQELISRVLLENRNKGSSVLYSPWASDHFYSNQNYWITLFIFLYRETFWTPEIIQRLDQLSKSVGSFGIRCSLGWVLGGLTCTIRSWAVHEKTAKTPLKRRFFGVKTTNCRPGHFYTFYSWQVFEIFVIHS